MLYRLILPDWAKEENPSLPKVLEGEYSDDDITHYNSVGYNVYFLPNSPSVKPAEGFVDGEHIDTFEYVFVDFDLKEGKYADKTSFISALSSINLPPTRVVDSGNGIHVYWKVADLDAMSFLKLQRRLLRRLNTDEAVAKIYQLMRLPDTLNTKKKDDLKRCEVIYNSDASYTCEQIDSKLPVLTKEDEAYCKQHYEKTYKLNTKNTQVDDRLPLKFCQLIQENQEIRDIWKGGADDRSGADFRLGHILFANGFSKSEAMSVLVNAAKALSRSPHHRITYAENIIDKIWTYELSDNKNALTLSRSVKDILSRGETTLKGTRFACWEYIDATHHGFRLGQVIGLVAGSGVGKTAMALNMFMGFVKKNPDYVHFFIPLEQPVNEIADRWQTMCGTNEALYDKVHVISNYADDGSFRHLSFDDIKKYIIEFQKEHQVKVGCVVIDHIGALKKKGKDGENQDLMTICHEMKAFAIATNTLLIMQSQSSREKAGIGDLELNKDAAYGTVYFESYCDYLITIWQPLKRVYSKDGCPTITSFKFCKIRHKKMGLDAVKEDVCYNLFFDSKNEHMRELTQKEQVSFDYFAKQALNRRKEDRKTDLVAYESISWTKEEPNGKTNSSKDSSTA